MLNLKTGLFLSAALFASTSFADAQQTELAQVSDGFNAETTYGFVLRMPQQRCCRRAKSRTRQRRRMDSTPREGHGSSSHKRNRRHQQHAT